MTRSLFALAILLLVGIPHGELLGRSDQLEGQAQLRSPKHPLAVTAPPNQFPERRQLTKEQRNQIYQQFPAAVQRNEVNRMRKTYVTIKVGTVVPGSIRVRLKTMPPQLADIAPAFTEFFAVAVEDDFIFVEPGTYRIAEVVSLQGYRSQTSRLELNLSQSEIVFIRAIVMIKERQSDFSVRLALGAEVPPPVSMMEFPTPVVERIPELRFFKYVIVERDIAICDPQTREIVQLI